MTRAELPHAPLSCYIRTKNEERMVEQIVRAALQVAREVVIVDSGSTDDTVTLARRAGAKVHHVDWMGNGYQKRAAEEFCTYAWKLDLDADEVVSEDLANEIKALFARGEPSRTVYSVPRVTAPPIGDPWWHTDRDHREKLYNSDYLRMPESAAWDQLDLPQGTPVGKLSQPLIHYSFSDIGFLLRKQERNMTQRAKAAPLKPLWQLRLRIMFGLPVYFLKRYLLKGLFLQGTYGFAFAMTVAQGRWLKDVKMYERHRLGHQQEARNPGDEKEAAHG